MQDLRDASRALAATPIVSMVAILSLALGIGANTAIFSIADSLLLKSLPVREPGRLVVMSIGGGPNPQRSITNPIWEQIRDRRHQLFDNALAFSSTRFNLASGGESEMVDGIWASGDYFSTLGVAAVLGRVFTEADDRRGGGPDGAVAVISYAFWQRRFGSASDTVGRTLRVNNVPFTIVGVTSPGFFGTEVGRTFDVAIPLGTDPLIRGKESFLDRRSTWWLTVMARLESGQSIEAATAALRGVQPQVREATTPQNWRAAEQQQYLTEPLVLEAAASGTSFLRRRYQQPVVMLMVIVGLVLLIACANIANLLLARATARRRELSVRLALGASRLRLARQLLAESLLLSGIGAALGLLFAQWGSRLLVAQLSTRSNNVFLELAPDWRILAFTAAVAVGTAVLFGTAPAFRAACVEPIEAMKEHARGAIGDGRAGLAGTLVVAQVALSLVLVVAAGLFVRTFASLANLDTGFDRDRVLVVNVNAQRLQLEPAARAPLFQRMLEAVRAVPGVSRAGISVVTPVSGTRWNTVVEIEGAPARSERDRTTNVNLITPGWLATYTTPLKTGRDLDDRDRRGAPRVVLVNEAFVKQFFDGRNPIGRVVRETWAPSGAPPSFEIVGVVGNAVYGSLREPVPATMYQALAQSDEVPTSASISVQTSGGSPALLARSLVAAIGGVNKDISLTLRPLADYVNASLIQERLVAMLSGFFGGLALLLAGLGLYGVTSYAVTRRRTEIGIRMALGAAPGGVVRLVLRRVAILVALGVAIGAGVSLWAARFVDTLLFGLPPRDPATLAAAAIVLIGVGAMAGWLPARRAARLDPALVLRDS